MADSRGHDITQLATQGIGKLLWQYSLPAVTGMIVTSLYNIIDRIYIGRGLGVEAISGLAVTFPVMNLSAALGVLIGAGAAARTSIMLGRGDKRSAELVLGNSLVLSLVIGTIYTLCFGIFVDEILMAFGASEVTLPYARDFMLWILPGMIVTNLCFSFNNVMRASGYPIKAMITMIIGAVLNIGLAPIFIFALDLGIKGAAIASDISMALSAAFVMWHFVKKDSEVHFKRGIYRLNLDIVKEIVLIGLAPSLVNAAACFITMIVNRSLVKYGGDIDVGAVGIFITYTSFLTTFIVGMGLGLQPIVGYNYGAGKQHRLKKAYFIALAVATGISTAGAALGLIKPRLIALIFTNDEYLIEVTVNGFRHAMLAFCVVGFQIISTNFVQSLGKAYKSILLGIVRQIIFMLPLLYLLPKELGLNGVWLSFPVSDILATIVTVVVIADQFREFRKKKANEVAIT